MPEATTGMVKITFHLKQDEDGYPPADVELLWANVIEEGKYEIDNIPFFARGISCGDVVSANNEGGRLIFRKVVRRSGNSTLRVIFFDNTKVQSLRDTLKELGCSSELSHLPNLISIDVPINSDLKPILDVLKTGELEGSWDYEEACLQG